MLSNNARDDLAGRPIIDVGLCPQNIFASSFFPQFVFLLLVLSPQCLLITYIFLACWKLSIIWGFWTWIQQKGSLTLQNVLAFSCRFLFFSRFSPSYPLLCSNPPVPSSRIYLRLLFHAASMPAAITASLFVWQTTAGDGFGALCNYLWKLWTALIIQMLSVWFYLAYHRKRLWKSRQEQKGSS